MLGPGGFLGNNMLISPCVGGLEQCISSLDQLVGGLDQSEAPTRIEGVPL